MSGTVNLAACALNPILGFASAIGETFTIIKSTAPVVGTFMGLSEGASFMIGNVPFTITYAGGGGDDVVLTQAVRATNTTVVASNNPAIAGQPLSFTATVAPQAGSGTPTGNFTFTFNGFNGGAVPIFIENGQDIATLDLAASAGQLRHHSRV